MPFFFFNDTATTEIYTLSLHDALPIFASHQKAVAAMEACRFKAETVPVEKDGTVTAGNAPGLDRKRTRLNSSYGRTAYVPFHLRKKKAPPRRHSQLAIRTASCTSVVLT